TRVSTEDQVKEGYSLEVQREYLEAFAKREGYEIFKAYSDEGISAFSTRRTALQKLLADAKTKKFDLVLVHKIDRFSRNLKDLLNLVDELSSYGVGFKSATEPFDTTTSAGKLMFQQLGSFAEFERNRIAERVFPGMVKGVQRGNWQGARFSPYGYKYNMEEKLLEVTNDEAKIVKLIYKMYLAGESTHTIVAYLNKRRYKSRTGKQFYTKFIGDVLKNRIYIGQIVWNKHHYDKSQKTKKHYKYVKNDPSEFIIAQGRHKPIISVEDFEKAQKLLAEKKRRWKPRSKNKEYLLSGLLTCSKCNHSYAGAVAISNHRTGAKKKWYRCSGPGSSAIRCTNKAVKAEDIEPQIDRIVELLIQNKRLQESRWITGTKPEIASPVPRRVQGRNDKEKVKDDLKINQQKQLKLTDTYLDNVLGEDIYRDKILELRSGEDELKKIVVGIELSELEKERSDGYIKMVREFIGGYDDNKSVMDFSDKKEICGLLFKNIKIAPPVGGAKAPQRISLSFFEPFSSFFEKPPFSEKNLFPKEQKRQKCLKNKTISKIRAQKFTSELSGVR
ncbi:MAG: recombinase family protein, partial [Elusimicrobia bacterium]|nr:recombinase family protein [Elusimicrobiota bacterium]